MPSKSKYPGVKRLPSGGIEYRGKKFAGFNKPRTSDRPGKKGMVLAKEGDKVKLIHFGAKGYGHNYSSAARKSFKARHAKNISKGKMSAAYWADRKLWAGPSGSKKSPPKGKKGKY
jgi:hypothetical protein